jgi:hypothetical protein
VIPCSPQVPSPHGDGPRSTPPHVRWRPVGAGFASLVTPFGIGVLHHVLGEVLATIEMAVALTIIGTALFGSSTLSERAFRLLRWIGNRPEPPVPPGRQAASPRRPSPRRTRHT